METSSRRKEKWRMRIYRAKDYADLSRKTAQIIAAQIIMKPDCVLGLATGSSPVGAYENLVKWYEEGALDFSAVTTVNLDEYRGLPQENAQSYDYFMQEHLFGKVNIDRSRTFLPDGMAQDDEQECRRYEEIIRSVGGVDLQLLGMGHNGHIGFNEPGSCFEKKTRCVDLAESTIRANRRFFASEEEVPRQAYTVGIGTILAARRILLIVSGKEKAGILNQALFGPVTPEVPASILQFHGDVTVVADEAALSCSKLK